MRGVKIVEYFAFAGCEALTDVECDKLEIIKDLAFNNCRSLRSINLPSARIVDACAFHTCTALTDVKFGSMLERIETAAFGDCSSLERITIPLKNGLINNDDNAFRGCENLKHVDLIEGELQETIASLHLEEWRNDVNEEIHSINRILPTAPAGDGWDDYDEGERARAIRRWIRSVLGKIIHYQVEHQRLLNEAANTLQLVLPQDFMMNSVLPFLALPSHTFEVGEDEDEDEVFSYYEGSSSDGENSEMELG